MRPRAGLVRETRERMRGFALSQRRGSARRALLGDYLSAGQRRDALLDGDGSACVKKWGGQRRHRSVEGSLALRVATERLNRMGDDVEARATRRGVLVQHRGVLDTGRETAERHVDLRKPVLVDLHVGGAVD